MNLSQLYYFSKLSELEHFSKAAKELYITQPSLSHAIKSLETELGVQLFEREGRRMRLTAFGKEFATYVKRGLREIDKGVERAQEFNGKLGGTVNIGAVLTVQGDYLPPLLHDFSENYGKEVKLNMFQGFSIPLVEGLENDKYDVVFAAAREQKPNLCYVRAVSHELVLVVNKDNPLAQRESISVSELSGYDLHTYRLGTPIAKRLTICWLNTAFRRSMIARTRFLWAASFPPGPMKWRWPRLLSASRRSGIFALSAYRRCRRISIRSTLFTRGMRIAAVLLSVSSNSRRIGWLPRMRFPASRIWKPVLNQGKSCERASARRAPFFCVAGIWGAVACGSVPAV